MALESATNINGLNPAWPLGGDTKGEGDNHLRLIKEVLVACFPYLSGALLRSVAKSSNFTVQTTDAFCVFDCSGTLVVNTQAAATLGLHMWMFYVRSGSIQIDPNASELVNGASSVVYTAGAWGIVFCDGTKFTVLSNASLPANAVFESNIADGSITPAKLSSGFGTAVPQAAIASDDWMLFLDTSDNLNLKRAQQVIPSGIMVPFGGPTAPTGWLMADGSTVSRTTYANLFAAIGTTWGAGDGSTTFKLPDTRGEFIRGLDAGRGVDSGRVIGSSQGDAIRNITGGVGANTGSSSGVFGTASGIFALSNGNNEFLESGGTFSGTRYLNFDLDVSRQVPTAAENRPRNIAAPYIIKI